ncbi:MAG: hypothetical protein ACLQSR_10970 [Limisphaerales bacterium]
MPGSFWVVIGIFIAGSVLAIRRIKDGTGIPMMAVLVTVAVWYVGDAFYNDYAHSYALIFDSDMLQNAWWQVAWFLIVFLVAVPYVHRWFNARHLGRQSGVLHLARFGVGYPSLQRQLDILFGGCAAVYAVLVLVAAIRLQGQILYFICPYLGTGPDPWGRERVGGGISALLTLAYYIDLMVATVFGVLAAVLNNRRIRFLSVILCFVSWPYYIFGRTRNVMLAIAIPAMLSWVFLRLRGSIFKKIFVLVALFVLVNGWMAFVIQNRTTANIASALKQKGFNLKEESDVHHEGLNMFEELCWINTFFKNGTFEPDWGAEFFAELVNPIPRGIWHGKPFIGVDYAIARGLGTHGNEATQGDAGIDASISTGMIGQGVVNFGRILGPVVSAFLMSFWVAILARQDLHISELGRLPLYACGMILTFNLGRDITLITLYPFVFGLAILWWWERRRPQVKSSQIQPNQAVLSAPPPTGSTRPQLFQRPAMRRRIVMQINRRKNSAQNVKWPKRPGENP